MKKSIVGVYQKLYSHKLIRNFMMIFTGQGVASIFNMLSTIIIVGGIGSTQHGILVVTQSYGSLFYSLFSFKTFQGLIKYLAKSRSEDDLESTKLYIKWSLIMDICSLCLMFVLGLLLQDVIINLMSWNVKLKKYCVIYLAIQLFYFQGTCIGLLRSYERYNCVVKALVISSIIRLFSYGICYISFKSFYSFFLSECLSQLVNYLLLIFYTYKLLKEKDLLNFYKVKLRLKKEFIMFNIYSNLTSSLDLPVNQITTLIINKYLGFEANSAYNVFTNLGSIINKLGDPINQVIYPEMNLLIIDKKYLEAKKLSKKLKLFMLGIFIFLSIGTYLSYPIWFHYFINDVNKYIWPFILYLAFMCYVDAAMGTHNLFMALGYVKYNIPILLVINVLYLIGLFYAVQILGLTGVILAYFIQAFLVVMIKEIILKLNNYQEYF